MAHRRYGAVLVIGLATLTSCRGHSPFADAPFDEFWAPQRPLGARLNAIRPTHDPPPESSRPTAQPPESSQPPASASHSTQAGASPSSHTAAAPEPSGLLSLREAMAAALLGNPELTAFGYEVRAAEAQALQARRWPNPELEVEVDNFAGSGERAGFGSSEFTLSLSQAFPLGGDIQARTRSARLAGKRVGWAYESARVSLMAEVTRRYVEALAARRRLALAEASVALADQVADSIGRRVEVGEAPAVERSRAAVPAAMASIERDKASRAVEAADARLAATWGGLAPTFSALAGDLETIAEPPSAAALTESIAEHPEVARWALEIAGRQAEVEQARAEAIPDLTASLGYRWFNDTDDGAFVAGLSIPLPIADDRRAAVLARRFGVASSRERGRAVRLRLGAALASNYARLADAYHEAVALRDRAVPPADRAYRDTKQAFERGVVGFLDVLDAERTLVNLRSRYIEALTEYHTAAADLEGLVGRPLTTLTRAAPLGSGIQIGTDVSDPANHDNHDSHDNDDSTKTTTTPNQPKEAQQP